MVAMSMSGGQSFLSTPSARRATMRLLRLCGAFLISIHALREEGDLWKRWRIQRGNPFLSTPSARRATTSSILSQARLKISIHALREEGDL